MSNDAHPLPEADSDAGQQRDRPNRPDGGLPFGGMRAALDGLGWRHRARDLLNLLARERQLLRSGDLDGLAGLEKRRAALVEAVMRHPPHASRETVGLLGRLRAEATRNQRLTGAFLEGLRHAAGSTRDLTQTAARIGLYSAQGVAEEPTPPALSADRRA